MRPVPFPGPPVAGDPDDTGIDRAADLRGRADLVPDLTRDPRCRVVVVHGDRLPTVTGEDGRPGLTYLAPADLGEPGPTATWVFLGLDRSEPGDPVPYLALLLLDDDGTPDPPLVPPGGGWAGLRAMAADLGPRDRGLATTALGLAAWHARHVRCPRCGAATVPVQAGWVRRCVADGSDHYPRTDPAVIMAVVDTDDRLLLGHAALWPGGRFSTLAGYVEPGESLEAAVRREVAEETTVRIGEVEYRASQPWPFPSSLMLAFRARALTTDIVVDGTEVTDARWFTRAQLAAAVSDGTVLLPSRSSIAWALIEEWRTGNPFRRT